MPRLSPWLCRGDGPAGRAWRGKGSAGVTSGKWRERGWVLPSEPRMIYYLPLRISDCGTEKTPLVPCVEHRCPSNISSRGVLQPKGTILGGITRYSKSWQQYRSRSKPPQISSHKHQQEMSTSYNSYQQANLKSTKQHQRMQASCSLFEIGHRQKVVPPGDSGYNTLARHGPVVPNSKTGLYRGADTTMGKWGGRGLRAKKKQIFTKIKDEWYAAKSKDIRAQLQSGVELHDIMSNGVILWPSALRAEWSAWPRDGDSPAM